MTGELGANQEGLFLTNSVSPVRRGKLYWLKSVVRVLIIGLVALGIWRTWDHARDAFAASQFSLSQLDYRWLLVAAACYLAGSLPMCLFWWNTLRALGQRPGFGETLRAYYVGQLGKYVPGKALVVVIRAGMIRGPRVDTTVAAASVFIETLTMMAVGAVTAAVILSLLFRHHASMALLALGLAACAGVPTLPPVFRRVVHYLQVRRANPQIDEALRGLNLRLMVTGWLGIGIGWLLFGLSLWATLRATPDVATLASPLEDIALLTACAALALIVGFLSLIPAGMGAREWVIATLLVPQYGPVAGIVSAVLLRVVWMAAELLCAGLLYAAGPRRSAERTPDVGDQAQLITAEKKTTAL